MMSSAKIIRSEVEPLKENLWLQQDGLKVFTPNGWSNITDESKFDTVKVVQYLRGVNSNGNSVNITVDDAIQKLLKDGLDTKFGSLYYDKNTIKYLVFADTTNRDLYINDPVTNSGLVLATWDAPASINEGYLFTKNDNAEVVAKMYAAGKCASSYGMTKSECQAVTSLLDSSGNSIFYEDTNLKSFDELQYFIGLTSLGYNCFYGCTSLTNITLPNSITSIGFYCFNSCTSLTSITIPNSITSIGDNCFDGCTSLTNITLSNSITSLGAACFKGCKALTSITLPNSITSLGNVCFYGCTSLTNITLPNTITSLDYCFMNCTSLTSITLPNTITSLVRCFSGCTSLTSITLPKTITNLDSCFKDCTSLASITLPTSITSLDGCFEGCSSLTSITLPNTITNLGYSCFEGCKALISISCLATSAPATTYSTFGNDSTSYTGSASSATKYLYVPSSATGYDNGDGWKVLLDSTKCNFKISKTL